MKPTYLTNLMSSFYLWLDHELLSRGDAYQIYSGKMYSRQDYHYADHISYASPFRQWVSDSSIAGAVIPSGVYVGGNFISKGTSGLAVNFNLGEISFNTGVSMTMQNVTARYSIKDFNIYYTDEREENLLFDNKYLVQSQTNRVTGALYPDDQPYPCIFIKNTSYENKPLSFAGQDKTMTTIRCIVLSDSIYTMDGAISIMVDTARKVFPIIPNSGLPYNYYGDFKSGTSYNYTGLAAYVQKNTPTDMVYIDRVTVSRLDEIRNKHINLKTVAALVDFDLWQGRYPRQYS
jgi:hypothetical protein